ncbi:MAG TPA: DNA adenine methylase, partial [Nitrospirae bacterium]|nr:DNA adenine methylase [Nitrospirota bacterium]
MGALQEAAVKRRGTVNICSIVWNDLNSDLVNLFRTVRNNLDKFKRRQFLLLASREEYRAFHQARMKGKFKDDIDRAIAFYYCIKNSFGSGVVTGWAFGPGRGPKYTVSLDKLIPNWDRPDTVFYCDPPYAMLLDQKGRTYYQCAFTKQDHKTLRDILKKIAGKFILSYDDHPLIKKLYRGFSIRRVKKVNYTLNNRPGVQPRYRPELIIT